MRYSLDSFKKYCRGFSGVTIVVPTTDVNDFLPLEGEYSEIGCPVLIKNFLEYPEKGFVHHLSMKCSADIFCPDADYILHMDPDSLFCDHCTPSSFILDGKPMLLAEPYEAIKTYHDGRYNWKSVTEAALGFDCPFETMCRHPSVYHYGLYRAVRDHIERKHMTPFHDFVLKQKNKFPQGFAEFPTLGAFALEKFGELYSIHNRGSDRGKNDPKAYVWQGWSYTGAESKENKDKINKILWGV